MEQQNTERSDEFSLYDFWKLISKRKTLIIGLFIVFVLSAAIGSFLMPDIYRGEAALVILRSDLITAKELTDVIGNVDYEKRLSIVPKSFSNVKNIKFKAFKDSKNKIIVTIDAKKTEDIHRALSEIINYLKNIDIIKSTVSIEKENLLQRSAELSEIVKSAPALLATYDQMLKAGKLSMMGFNMLDVNKRFVETKMELLSVNQQLSRLNNGGVEIASQPYISNDPVSPKRLSNVVVAGIVSLFLGVFLAVLLEYIGNIKHKKKQTSRQFFS